MEKSSVARLTGVLGLFLLCLLGSQIPILAQEAVSNIIGSVTDTTGAVVPKATIALLNQRTGVSRSQVSREDGTYRFADIEAGLYTVTVEETGFKKYAHSDIDLTPATTIQIDAKLEVGKTAEQITVSGTPGIETQVPTVSASMRSELVNEIPLSGGGGSYRIPMTLFMVLPGAAPGISTAGFNGMPISSERWTLDGGEMAPSCCQATPPLGSIEETTVITHDAPAEYVSPVTMQLTSKSGTNHFHGDAWWLYQDKLFDARNYFYAAKPFFHGNTFGYSVGGPILKNKLFFFVGGEVVRLATSSTTYTSSLATVNLPSALMQQGNFSELITPAWVNQYNGGVSVTVKDPLTGQPFPGNIIPTDRLSSVSQNLIKELWTTPQSAGIYQNAKYNTAGPNARDKVDVRIDYALSPKHTIFGRYGNYSANFTFGTTDLRPQNTSDETLVDPGRNVSVSDVYVFAPWVTNEFLFSYVANPNVEFANPFQRQDILGAAGMSGTNGVLGLPGMSFVNFTGFSGSARTLSTNDTKMFADNVSMVRGRHTLKFGFMYTLKHNLNNASTSPASFGFDDSLTGWDWASFMLGLPSSVTQSLGSPSYSLVNSEFGVYAQDAIRLTRALTVNLGLRYQRTPWEYDKDDRLAVFDPKTQALIVPSLNAKNEIVPTFPTQTIPILTAAEANYPARTRALTNTDNHDFAPRVGVAWRPFGREDTVVRGGFGIYYETQFGAGPGSSGTPFSGSDTLYQTLGPSGTLVPSIEFPTPFTAFSSAGVSTLSPLGIVLDGGDPNARVPYIEDWNLTAEHDFHGRAAVRVSYLGSAERRSLLPYNINAAPPGNLPFDQSRLPFPQFSNLSYTGNGGSAHSNALQVIVDRRLSHGMMINGAYTWLHKVSDLDFTGVGAEMDNNRQFTSNPSFGTPREQLILTYIWEVPVGRGRPFLSQLSSVPDGVFGGWKLAGMTKFETGQYLMPYYVGVNPAGTTPGTAAFLPDRIGDGNLSRGTRVSNAPNLPYFNPAAFACPGGSSFDGQPNLLSAGCPLSTPENVGRFGDSAPYIIQGPGANVWAWSVSKEFGMWHDKTKLEVSAQISNPWNHPNWSAPSMNLSSPSSVGLISSTTDLIIDPWSFGRRRIALQAKVKF